MDDVAARRLERAVAVVQRDVDTAGLRRTLAVTRVGDSWAVMVKDYHWGGGPPLEAEDDDNALASVAEGAQDLLMCAFHTVWPTCPTHNRGLHLFSRRLLWRCHGGPRPHDLGRVGELRLPEGHP